MAVPNTNTFSMRNVADEIGVSYSGRTLTELFGLATGQFDPNYVGSKNSLYNFRNYIHQEPYSYIGIYIDPGENTALLGLEVSQETENKYIYYSTLLNTGIKIIEVKKDSTNIINSYFWDASNHHNSGSPVAISFKSPTEMYVSYDDSVWDNKTRAIYKYNLSIPYRPDLGTVTISSNIFITTFNPNTFYMSKKGNQSHGALLSGDINSTDETPIEVLKVNTINNSGSLTGATFSSGFNLGNFDSFCFGNPEEGLTGYSARPDTNGELTILKRYFNVAYDPSTTYRTETHIIKGFNVSSDYVPNISYYDTNKILLSLSTLQWGSRLYIITVDDKLTP